MDPSCSGSLLRQVERLKNRLKSSEDECEDKVGRIEHKFRAVLTETQRASSAQNSKIEMLQTQNYSLSTANKKAELVRIKNTREKENDLNQLINLHDVVQQQRQMMEQQKLQCEKADKEILKLSKLLRESERDKDQGQAVLEREKKGFETHSRNLQSQLQEKANEINDSRHTHSEMVARLTQEKSDITERMASLQTDLDNKETQIAKQASIHTEREQKQDSHIDKLSKELASATAVIAEMKGEAKAQAIRIKEGERVKDELATVTASTMDLRDKLLQESSTRSRLEGEVEVLKSNLESAQSTMHTFEQERVSWLSAQESRQKEIQALTVQLSQLQAMHKETERHCVEHLEAKSRTQEMLTASMSQVENHKDTICRLQKELTTRDQHDRERELREQRERAERTAREDQERRERRDAAELQQQQYQKMEQEKDCLLQKAQTEFKVREELLITQRRESEEMLRTEMREKEDEWRAKWRTQEDTITQLKGTIAELEGKVQELEDKNHNLDQQVTQLTTTEMRNQVALDKLSDKILNLKERQAQILHFERWKNQAALETKEKEYDKRLKEAAESHQQVVESLESEKSGLELCVESLQCNLKELQATLQELTHSLEALEKEKEEDNKRKGVRSKWSRTVKGVCGSLAEAEDEAEDDQKHDDDDNEDSKNDEDTEEQEAEGAVSPKAISLVTMTRKTGDSSGLPSPQRSTAASRAKATAAMCKMKSLVALGKARKLSSASSSPLKSPKSSSRTLKSPKAKKSSFKKKKSIKSIKSKTRGACKTTKTTTTSTSKNGGRTASTTKGLGKGKAIMAVAATIKAAKEAPLTPSSSESSEPFTPYQPAILGSDLFAPLSPDSLDASDSSCLPVLPPSFGSPVSDGSSPSPVPPPRVSSVSRGTCSAPLMSAVRSLDQEIMDVVGKEKAGLGCSSVKHRPYGNRVPPATGATVHVPYRPTTQNVWDELAGLYTEIENKARSAEDSSPALSDVSDDPPHTRRGFLRPGCVGGRIPRNLTAHNDFTGCHNVHGSRQLDDFEAENRRVAGGVDNILTQMQLKGHAKRRAMGAC